MIKETPNFYAHCLDIKRGVEFDKIFNNPIDLRKFIIKCDYSKKIKILSWHSICDIWQ